MQLPAERLKAMLWRVKWHCLFDHVYHLQKNNTIIWSFLITQSVTFTCAAFKAFAEAYLCFIVFARKKNVEAIKFLEILQKMSPIIAIKFLEILQKMSPRIAIKFLEILQKMSPRIKYIFV